MNFLPVFRMTFKNIKNTGRVHHINRKKSNFTHKQQNEELWRTTTFFTQEEHKQLILLYKRLLRLSKDTLQKDDCHKLKTHLVKAMAEGTIPRNVFQMNPIIKDMQTAVIVAEEIGMRRASILGSCSMNP